MKIDLSAHHCETVIFSCIDFRFGSAIREEISKQAKSFDYIAMAGGSKAITDSDTQAAALKQIGLAKRLHGAVRVVLVDHVQCGGFGANETEHDHAENLAKAKTMIEQNCALAVATYLATVDNSNNFELKSMNFR